MKTATEILDADLNHWVPGTRFFSTSDGKYFVVDADTADYPRGPFTIIRRDTAVIDCTADATVISPISKQLFPPGTSAEEAIAAMGYTLE